MFQSLFFLSYSSEGSETQQGYKSAITLTINIENETVLFINNCTRRYLKRVLDSLFLVHNFYNSLFLAHNFYNSLFLAHNFYNSLFLAHNFYNSFSQGLQS